HVAEFLKANLRHGVVVRPWVYEALAIALDACKADPEEIRRARLSAVALDPTDSQGFLQAARAMADGKQYDRALAFCRQAALLEPNLAQPYVQALVYAELAKDSKSMEWAASKLVSQDWATDSPKLHKEAADRLTALSATLQRENRGTEADRLKAVLQQLKRRDLVVHLTWDTAGGEIAGLELEVKEPTGSVCSDRQRHSPGGGVLIGGTLTDPNRISYLAAEAFSGEYEITVRRLWGQTIGSRARLEIIQHLGTPQETRRIETVRVDQKNSIKIVLSQGRRFELAAVPPPAVQKRLEGKDEIKPQSVVEKLRGLAFPDFSGMTGSKLNSSAPAQVRSSVAALAPKADFNTQAALRGGAVQMTTQLRVSDRGELEMELRPVFQGGGRPSFNLPGIPGQPK
ncbi:MAG: hypothetical protein NZO58_01940, partial [Gemmataceae bacterium]|nr:hypothetical protein [Gemmataceae bacterium]